MKMNPAQIGVHVPRILLPAPDADFYRWAVVACDQYTSQPEYWEDVERLVGDAPSTLHLTLPEAYLGKPEEAERLKTVRGYMNDYLESGVLKELPAGFVLVERQAEGKVRHGLVLALDLEAYDYHKGATSLIRATEGTIEDRIPPRLRIRSGAPLELPHILVLIDDPDCTVIEPLTARAAEFPCLYDTDLMKDGGHISGRLISSEKDLDSVIAALTALADADAFREKYGDKAPLLFAMGDGNHSFATAKAHWENVKATLSPEERESHPARYALVEIENVHDAGIVFEPIHRVVFGMKGDELLSRLVSVLKEQNGSVRLSAEAGAPSSAHVLPYFYADAKGYVIVEKPVRQLAVGTLQAALDALKGTGITVDYIHGADVVKELSAQPDTVGFLLPAMEKSDLFPTVVYDGALPRKTFSMGEANEKRFYLESRRITE